MAEGSSDVGNQIYHEKQKLQLCAIHAINNLFQNSNACQKQCMDEICEELSPGRWLNPHKSNLGLGNYDVNAIMAVLQRMGYDIVWFDKRGSLEDIVFDKVFGIFLNTIGKVFGINIRLWSCRHWLTLKKIEDIYYNLDSKLKAPELIGNEIDVKEFIKLKLDERTAEMILVVSSDVKEAKSWKKTVASS